MRPDRGRWWQRVVVELVLIVVGGLVLGLGVWSNFLRRHTWVPEPFVALLVGILIGPIGLGLFDPTAWGVEDVLHEHVARLTLAVALMAVALRLPPHHLERHRRSVAFVVLLVMPFMWLAAGTLVHLVLGIPFWLALVVGAVLTPTDPIVITAMMVGPFAEKRLPERIRHLLSMEAGANDGLALPLLVLPALVLAATPGGPLVGELAIVLLWEVGGAGVLGVGLGFLVGKVLTWSEERQLVERHSLLSVSLALTLLTLGIGEALGMEGVFAVFMAGLAFTPAVGDQERAEEEGVQEAVSQFFYLPAFALVGATLPWSAWVDLGWRAPLLVIAVLALRRLPVLVLAPGWIHTLRGRPDRLFVGWFGPMGASTLLYAAMALERTGEPIVWTVASLLIAASVLVHGMTANPLTRLYDRHATAPDPDGGGEAEPVEGGEGPAESAGG